MDHLVPLPCHMWNWNKIKGKDLPIPEWYKAPFNKLSFWQQSSGNNGMPAPEAVPRQVRQFSN